MSSIGAINAIFTRLFQAWGHNRVFRLLVGCSHFRLDGSRDHRSDVIFEVSTTGFLLAPHWHKTSSSHRLRDIYTSVPDRVALTICCRSLDTIELRLQWLVAGSPQKAINPATNTADYSLLVTMRLSRNFLRLINLIDTISVAVNNGIIALCWRRHFKMSVVGVSS